MGTDTIDVRPDERLDEARLADYLRGKLPDTDQPPTIRQFGGGAANLTYLLDYGTHQYVLRRPPLGPVAKSAHDMKREYSVLSVLNQAFPYAPQAYLYCADPQVIGADFFVMARCHGIVVRRSIPDAYAHQPDAPRHMSEALIDALADLHAVDYAALSLSELGKPSGFVERQIEGWYKRWQAAKTDDVPVMDTVYEWLKNNIPTSAEVSLIHSDYKLDNVMLAEDDPGRIVAIFDWDMCTLGDPLTDLGALLAYWTEPTDPVFRQSVSMMHSADSGFLSRDALVERYAQRSGRSVNDIGFYHTLGLFRIVVIAAQIYVRYVRGQTHDQRFAAFATVIPLLAKAAQEVSQGITQS